MFTREEFFSFVIYIILFLSLIYKKIIDSFVGKISKFFLKKSENDNLNCKIND